MTSTTTTRRAAVQDERVQAYLERIGYAGPAEPTLDVLQAMHRAHFYTVPFENLDIRAGVRLSLNEERTFAKIATQRRGGFCLEVNSLFAAMLRRIGFEVDILGARVFSDGSLGPPMTHMTLLVHLDEPWIADVGFGARIIEPLRLNERAPQRFGDRAYVVANDGDHYFVTVHEPGGPSTSYTFTTEPRQIADFGEACEWLETSPMSRFTQSDVVTLPTRDGRMTLGADRLVVSHASTREELPIRGLQERAAVLRDRFGLEFEAKEFSKTV